MEDGYRREVSEYDVPNKCYSCYYSNGARSQYTVMCNLKKTCVNGIAGCSSYTPDEAAHCSNYCLYLVKKIRYKCEISGQFDPEVYYCKNHIYKNFWDRRDDKKSKGCFITTATCEYHGFSDDCETLTNLRAFRDEILVNNKKWKKLVDNYYVIAPNLVDKINSSNKREYIYKSLYTNYIVKLSETSSNEKEHIKRIILYKKMIQWIKKELRMGI